MPNFEEFFFKVGPSFIGYQYLLSTPIQDGGFARVVTNNANILVTKVLTFSIYFENDTFDSTSIPCDKKIAMYGEVHEKLTRLQPMYTYAQLGYPKGMSSAKTVNF